MTNAITFAQFPKDPETGKVVYSDVIELPGLDKKTIYDKAKLWVVSTLKSGDNMVELGGSTSDQIVGTGNINLDSIIYNPMFKNLYMNDANLNFKFIVFCKDGRLKYSIENFTMSTMAGSGSLYYDKTSLEDLKPPPTNNIKEKHLAIWKSETEAYLHRQINSLIANFVRSMRVEKNDDW